MYKVTKTFLRFFSLFSLMVLVFFGGFITKVSHNSDEGKKKGEGEGEKFADKYIYSAFPVGTALADVPGSPSPSVDPCPSGPAGPAGPGPC
jgi:hypothetical protein